MLCCHTVNIIAYRWKYTIISIKNRMKCRFFLLKTEHQLYFFIQIDNTMKIIILRKINLLDSFDKCFISIQFVLCIVFAYVAGDGLYIYVYML